MCFVYTYENFYRFQTKSIYKENMQVMLSKNAFKAKYLKKKFDHISVFVCFIHSILQFNYCTCRFRSIALSYQSNTLNITILSQKRIEI